MCWRAFRSLVNRSAPAADADVLGLAYDSRKVTTGYLFFAFAGAKADGTQFANTALQQGALAVISDRPHPGGFAGLWLQVAAWAGSAGNGCAQFLSTAG